MNRYIATIDIAQNKCVGLTILQEVPESTEDFLYVEVPDHTYHGRSYIDGVWGEEVESESAEQETAPLTLQEQIDKLGQKLDAKIDYDVQVNLDREFQLAMIEINTLKGGE